MPCWIESSKDNTQTPYQTRYQLNSHLQSNTLELDDKAQTLSYEHYYPYGGTAIIAGFLGFFQAFCMHRQ
jgi:insecticidal toxin complex protein TccC